MGKEIKNGVDEQDLSTTEEKVKKKKKTEKELLNEEVDALREENNMMEDKMIRAIAELENFKKRVEKERLNERKYNNIYLIEKLLPALDQFNLVVNANVNDEKLKNYLIGFKMISKQLFDVLEEDGLKQIETDGKKFDPTYHDAVEKEKDETKEKGIILKTTQTGYIYKERILRPAIVVVNEWSDDDGNNK